MTDLLPRTDDCFWQSFPRWKNGKIPPNFGRIRPISHWNHVDNPGHLGVLLFLLSPTFFFYLSSFSRHFFRAATTLFAGADRHLGYWKMPRAAFSTDSFKRRKVFTHFLFRCLKTCSDFYLALWAHRPITIMNEWMLMTSGTLRDKSDKCPSSEIIITWPLPCWLRRPNKTSLFSHICSKGSILSVLNERRKEMNALQI